MSTDDVSTIIPPPNDFLSDQDLVSDPVWEGFPPYRVPVVCSDDRPTWVPSYDSLS